ncbi:MAG TPA: DUF3471 domain-containing protein [Gammaproteobacteria bacterium]
MRFDLPPAAFLILALTVAGAFVWMRLTLEPDLGAWRSQGAPQAPARASRDATPVDAQVLARYAGEYDMDGMRVAIELEGGRLFVSPARGVRLPLYAETETRFFLTDPEGQIDFVVNARGEATRFLARLPSGVFTAQRVGG